MLGTGGREDSPLHSLIKPRFAAGSNEYEDNAAWSETRYPLFSSKPRPRLAVVGGGPSAKGHLDELRHWDGDIWAVKETVKWLAGHGIKSTLFSCHPTYTGDWASFAESAILSSSCPRNLFESLSCQIEIFHTDAKRAVNIVGGCTSLAKTPHLSILMGYREVHFFGADSSAQDTSHTYKNSSLSRLPVKCGGKVFHAQADWIWQAEHMQQLFAMAPNVYINRSGGFMQAMCENNGIYEVVYDDAS